MFETEPLQQVDRTYVLWRRRKLWYFSGCDYFRLASHPQVMAAVAVGLRRYGLNVAASRVTSGNHVLYLKLERRLAQFFRMPAALLVSSGYAANLTVAQGLAGQFSHGLIDAAAHPSLQDAAAALECPVMTFSHRSVSGLAAAIERCGTECKPIVLTDGLFARDGTVAPLKEYLSKLPPQGMLLVDDAHGAGVLGKNGRGSLEDCGVQPDSQRIIQTITLSKAFGAYGGAILASRALRQRLATRSRLFAGSTPLPLPLAQAALQAIDLLERDKMFRKRLARNKIQIKEALARAHVELPEAPGPVIALRPNTPSAAARMKMALLRAEIYPPLIDYPGTGGAYFRFVISSEHTARQLARLGQALAGNAHLFKPLQSKAD